MHAEHWLMLTDYASKYRISVSTLRRRIKQGGIKYRMNAGKYFIYDAPPKMAENAATSADNLRFPGIQTYAADQVSLLDPANGDAPVSSQALEQQANEEGQRTERQQPEKQNPEKQSDQRADELRVQHQHETDQDQDDTDTRISKFFANLANTLPDSGTTEAEANIAQADHAVQAEQVPSIDHIHNALPFRPNEPFSDANGGMASDHPQPEFAAHAAPSGSDEPIISTATRLLGELKRAYMNILQEKEEQLIHLKEEVSDLKTLVRVLEEDNERMRRILSQPSFLANEGMR